MPDHDQPPLHTQQPGTSGTSASPLRVLLLAPAGSTHTRRWADDLAERGHAVTVCSWHDDGSPPTGWRSVAAPAPGARPPWRAVRAAGWLRREVRLAKPDVVHIHSLGVHGALSLALPVLATPRVITPWGSELRAAERHFGRALIAQMALHQAALVLPTSQEVAEQVASRYRIPRSRIKVLSWGVPDALLDAQDDADPQLIRARYSIPAGATVALSVRSTSEVYRTHEILTAFARAARLRPDLFLVVVAGHRPAPPAAARAQRDYLAMLRIRTVALADQVAVIDRPLSRTEMFSLMCASQLAISVPQADQRSSSVLEAAAAGCRLVLSDIAPYRELAEDGLLADLLPDPLEATLAAALARAVPLSDADRRANRHFISLTERSSTKIAQLERLYDDLTNARAGKR